MTPGSRYKYVDIGLFILRLGLGAMFIYHGASKLVAGQEMWLNLGRAMSVFGITSWPLFWGLMATLAEFAGGICFVLGVLFRPASVILFFVMFVATCMHLSQGTDLQSASPAIENGIVFLALAIAGPGKHTFRL